LIWAKWLPSSNVLAWEEKELVK